MEEALRRVSAVGGEMTISGISERCSVSGVSDPTWGFRGIRVALLPEQPRGLAQPLDLRRGEGPRESKQTFLSELERTPRKR